MNDADVMRRINGLVDEEHDLWNCAAAGELDEAGHERLRSLQVTLDQLWDYLRQRRARRDAGQDPDQAHVRPPEIVERYLQ